VQVRTIIPPSGGCLQRNQKKLVRSPHNELLNLRGRMNTLSAKQNFFVSLVDYTSGYIVGREHECHSSGEGSCFTLPSRQKFLPSVGERPNFSNDSRLSQRLVNLRDGWPEISSRSVHLCSKLWFESALGVEVCKLCIPQDYTALSHPGLLWLTCPVCQEFLNILPP